MWQKPNRAKTQHGKNLTRQKPNAAKNPTRQKPNAAKSQHGKNPTRQKPLGLQSVSLQTYQ